MLDLAETTVIPIVTKPANDSSSDDEGDFMGIVHEGDEDEHDSDELDDGDGDDADVVADAN